MPPEIDRLEEQESEEEARERQEGGHAAGRVGAHDEDGHHRDHEHAEEGATGPHRQESVELPAVAQEEREGGDLDRVGDQPGRQDPAARGRVEHRPEGERDERDHGQARGRVAWERAHRSSSAFLRGSITMW
jgi:hypothetical protein